MSFYCGLDLGATHCQVCVVDEAMEVQVERKVRNELGRITELLERYDPAPQCVVESTFNWYWLVDGLMEAGYEICLAHALGVRLITAAKVKTDRRDAFGLAKLLRADLIPKAYIYPKATRPVRDLTRRRQRLVHLRGGEYARVRCVLYQHGVLEHSRNSIKTLSEEELAAYLDHPLVRVEARQSCERIELYSRQVRELEKRILATVKDNTPYRRLLGVPGLGEILAITVYYELGEVGRFKNAGQCSSYCRVVPGVAQSGAREAPGRGSKQGNSYLKSAFTQAAVQAVQWYPGIKRHFDRQLARHRGRGQKLIAYGIIAHKLACAVYHILRDGTEYQQNLLFGG